MPRSTTATPKPPAKRRSTLQKVLRSLALILDIFVGLALCVTAYAGNVSPLQHGGIWGILPLCFPFCLAGALLLAIAQCFWHRRGAIVLTAAMLVCAGPILRFSPLHFGKVEVPAGASEFTLLSYNVHNFLRPGVLANSDTVENEATRYILDTDADFVCLQEATYLGVVRKGILTPAQIEEMHRAYPYVLTGGDIAFLSKYPVEAIHLGNTKEDFKGGYIGCYRVTLPSGRLLTIFNVHLESMRLRADDRQVYVNITGLHQESLGEVKNRVLSKLSKAAVDRARQAQQLLRYVRLYGGPNVIISGDFNDVPGCYTIHALADAGFHSAYADRGCGPTHTFNQSRIYFRIDHTLYRGALTPLSISRGSTTASDHYPLLSSWAIE